jgi:Fic family protein
MEFKPTFSITNTINNALADIERHRGFLEAAQLSETWVSGMQNKALVLEAHHTTHIEGTQLTLEQSESILQGNIDDDVNIDDKQEVLNYRIAFERVSDYLKKELPVTEVLIREIHKILVKDVRGNSADPGAYRKIQNYVVNSKTKAVIYTPPPAYEVQRLIKELVDWLNTKQELNPVLVSGIAQFQFVHIHPFIDGNGRTARLLCTLYLYKKGYDFKRLFSISEYYDKNRQTYYNALQSVRNNDMDLTTWLEYFSVGLQSQLKHVREKGESEIKMDVLSVKHSFNDRQRLILRKAIEQDTVSIKDLEEQFKTVGRRTIQRDLSLLVSKGILEKTGSTSALIYKLKEAL